MQCDTLSDVPEIACNPLYLNELLFAQLKNFVGPIFTGLASQAYGLGDLDWGREIQLSSTETMQMRIYPRGILSSGKLLEVKNQVIFIATRRRGPIGKDHVAFAILWHEAKEVDLKFSSFDIMKTSTDCVATRNLHILIPSLFNHHDAMYCNRNKTFPDWPILDNQNYHAVRPSSYSVHTWVRMPKGEKVRRITATPGISQFVIAGQLSGAGIKDCDHRSVDTIPQQQWERITHECTAQIEKASGVEKGLSCVHNSLHFTDCITSEGLLAIIGHNFSGGAMPDMMHEPRGFPLLIAFMVRLACYPRRFGMVDGHDVDILANKQVISLFESNWEPIHPERAGGRNIYAIDLAIRQAHTEAVTEAKRCEKTETPVEDNLIFWHRAGQRCISAIFGAKSEDFTPSKTTLGFPEKLVDPLLEARNSVLRSRVNPVMAVCGTTSVISCLVSMQERRNSLLQVLSSVENWLRTGTYCGLEINKRKTSKVNVRVKRTSSKHVLTKETFTKFLDKQMEDTALQALASGEAKTIEEAREQAQSMRDGIEGALQFDANGTIQLSDLATHMHNDIFEVQNDKSIPKACAASPSSSNISESDFEEMICEDAMNHAVNLVSASMCQGSLVHLEFGVGCFLSSSNSKNRCADCDSEVHVLTAAFLATNSGQCARCHRSRCLVCATAAHKRRKASFGCKRCKAGSSTSTGTESAGPSGQNVSNESKKSTPGSKNKNKV